VTSCPFCSTQYTGYTIIGVLPASEHLTEWLEPVPMALLGCGECGKFTLMHPDHPDVQRLPKGRPYEDAEGSVRTLNVPVAEVGDPELRHQFEAGLDDGT
jgi:hypothetical protein